MDAASLEHIAKVYRVPSLLPWRPARRVEALRDITFHAPRRRVSCLLGPNGAGKTTIVKILGGVIEADRGGGQVMGTPLARMGSDERARVGFLSANDRSFYWRLTGRQNLDFFASLHGLRGRARRQRVDEVLGEVSLEGEADKPYRAYSSGMKQRMLMARALLSRPLLLLLDEPCSHLDPAARAQMHAFITRTLVRARGCSVLLCTNDLAEAQDLADHLILIDDGRVLAEGPLGLLRSRAQSPGALALVFEKLPTRGWDRGLGLRQLRRREKAFEYAAAPGTRTADVVEAAVRHGGRIASCTRSEAPLSEIFRQIVRPRP